MPWSRVRATPRSGARSANGSYSERIQLVDASNFNAWIGKNEKPPADTITPRIIAEFVATFDKHVSLSETVPPGLHWCLAPPTTSASGLGEDGHPAKGGFLPPIPLPRRMWASGKVDFLSPLQPNDLVQKSSTIKDIAFKSGQSGSLCFVTVEHRYSIDGRTAIREDQTIVYREAATGPAPLPAKKDIPNDLDVLSGIAISTTTLFRYSALTFNGHRIHYDLPYAQNVEFYPDLVVHGPLQAMLLLNLATNTKGRLPARFTYRGTAPATGAQTLRLGARQTAEGYDLSVYSEIGNVSMTAKAAW